VGNYNPTQTGQPSETKATDGWGCKHFARLIALPSVAQQDIREQQVSGTALPP